MVLVAESGTPLEELAIWPTHPLLYGLSERVMLFGSLLAVVLGATAWALFIRKTPRRRRPHYHYANRQAEPGTSPANGAADENKKRSIRHKRRRLRPIRTLNPTLAETRGLPPIRKESTPNPDN